ncbi:MAG: UBP-type zinc finger domain-containing protein [Candidatus Kariarchaeaceae archaeon]|jgi:uncharacterized UBP type Zn finger protein
MSSLCSHFSQINQNLKLERLETTAGCFECLKINGTWVNLRQCLTCGRVYCCDSSPNKHATAHWNETKHPVMRMLETMYDWCYQDEMLKENG